MGLAFFGIPLCNNCLIAVLIFLNDLDMSAADFLVVLICDIRNFTTISEINEAENVVEFLNSYFARMGSIIKKHGGETASQDPELRAHLIEELADVLMYYNDVLLCYGITAGELKESYTKKFQKNMKCW